MKTLMMMKKPKKTKKSQNPATEATGRKMDVVFYCAFFAKV